MPVSILIIDDYADNRELLRLMLEQAGYLVREAEGGREGVLMAREAPPDAALIDLSMPGLDGWAVIEELRADERTRHIPCAAISAFADGARVRALRSGFDAYLTKPFRQSDLIRMVEQLLVQGRITEQPGAGSRREEIF